MIRIILPFFLFFALAMTGCGRKVPDVKVNNRGAHTIRLETMREQGASSDSLLIVEEKILAQMETELSNAKRKAAHEHSLWVAMLVAFCVLAGANVAGLLWFWHSRRKAACNVISESVGPTADAVVAEEPEDSPEITAAHDILSDTYVITSENDAAFSQAFTTVYPGFVDRLRERLPSVTRGEILLCMMICLHYNVDRMATMMGISRASVNTARYRLRTKLGMGHDDNLNEIIRQLIS